MKIKIFSSEEFEKLETDWKRLEQGSEMTAFQSYFWYKSLNNLYKKEYVKNLFRDFFYVVAYKNDAAIMIAPLEYIKCSFKLLGVEKGIYFIGHRGYTDYLNFIYTDFSYEALEMILETVRKKTKINNFFFELLKPNSAMSVLLSEKGEPVKETVCAAMSMPKTFEEYKKALSKSSRQNIRTALNRQEKNNFHFIHEFNFTELDTESKKAFLSIRKKRVKNKQAFEKSKMSWKGKLYNAVFSALSQIFDKSHNIIFDDLNSWSFIVKNGSDIVGFFWGITNVKKDKLYVIYSGVKKEFEWYSPVISHFYLYIEELYNSGKMNIKQIDFTRGGEKYKLDLGCSLENSLSFKTK